MTTLRISLPNKRYRRLAGLLLGALLGLCYGLVSQLGDRPALPGVPLYQPPYGPVLNIVMYTVGAALLGVLVGWPQSGIAGTAIVALGSAAAIISWSLLSSRQNSGSLLVNTIIGIFLALPFWGMLVPIFGALRWVISNLEEAARDRSRWLRRLPGPLVLLLVVALVAATTLTPSRGREILRRYDALLDQMVATRSIPSELKHLEQLPGHLGSPYQLSWEGTNIERFRIPRPARNFATHSAAIARFADGWNLVCIYITADEPPLCQGFDTLP